jgi:hypothetical protein
MCMRNLEKRLEKLEQTYTPAEIIVIMITHWGGELKGWQGDGFYIARQPGESEEDLEERAAAEARAYGQAHPSLVRNGFISVHMDVEREPHVQPEPKPDPVATTQPPQPTVKAKQPLSTPSPKPQPPRIMTIKEVEGDYADRPDWMG